MVTKREPWKKLYDSIRVIRDADRVYVPLVTDAELDKVESALDFPLPVSYRAFMKTFGPGDLVGFWIRAVVEKQTRPPNTVTQATLEYRKASQKYPDDFPNGEWHSGVVCFAGCGPHDLAWNSQDAGESKLREYPVYDLCSEEEQEPKVVADSFWKFVEWVEEGSRSPHNPYRLGDGGLYFRPAELVGGKKRSR